MKGAHQDRCRNCGPLPFHPEHCRVSLATLEVRWHCRCQLHVWTTGPRIAVWLAAYGAAISETLPDPLEREARAFAAALEDSHPSELWAAIEATRSQP